MGRISIQQRRMEIAKAVQRINTVIKHPQFLKFVQVYTEKFRQNKGYGRWLHEYQVADEQGQFEPNAIRKNYIDILLKRDNLNFHINCATYHIGIYAENAAKAYIDTRIKALYSIVVFTGEIATDDDDDPYTDLSYDEAVEICNLLNEEAEEELFKIKKQ